MKTELTQERLKELLDYDPDTGAFTWLQDAPRGKTKTGDRAGCYRPEGYHVIGIRRRRYRSHRLAWLWIHGVWPSASLDHINGDPSDNRLVNLREASYPQNAHNAKLRKDNTSGYKGVFWVNHCMKWGAQFVLMGNNIYLGLFENKLDAVTAVRSAREKYHGEFARHS